MSPPVPEEAVKELLQRLADYAHTERVVVPEPLVARHRRRRPTWTIAAAAALVVAAVAGASLLVRRGRDRPVSTIGEPAALPGGTTDRLAATELAGEAAQRRSGRAENCWSGAVRAVGPARRPSSPTAPPSTR